MGDYTSLTFQINEPDALPPGYPERIMDMFDGFASERSDSGATNDTMWSMEGNDAPVGSAEEATNALIELMKGDTDAEPPLPPHEFAFSVWEDPKYEWLGDLFIYRPGRKLYRADCDSSGTPVVKFHHVKDVIAETSTRDELIARLYDIFGEAQVIDGELVITPPAIEAGGAPA